MERLLRPRGSLRGHWSATSLAAAAASSICVGLLLAVTDLKTEGTALYRDPGWDRHVYRLMAEQGLFEVRLAPYCWRVLMPAVAGWSPLSVQASFFSLTAAAVWATGLVLAATVRARGHGVLPALIIVVLFYALGWGPKFILADFWIPDGLAVLLVTLMLWAAVRKKLVLFALFLVVGAVTKESVLLAAPTYAALNVGWPISPGQLRTQALAVAPAAAALVALRLAVPHHNGDAAYLATLPEGIRRFPELYAHYDYRRLFQEIAMEQRWRDRSLDAVLDYTLRPLGLPLIVLAAIGLRTSWRLAIALLPFTVLTYAQLLFATDTQRLIVLAAPGLALLAADGVARLERAGVPGLLLFGSSAGALGLTLLEPGIYDPPLIAQALLLVGTGICALLLAWRRPALPPPQSGSPSSGSPQGPA